MTNKLPKILDNHKICIICEGNEEYEYLKRLKDLKVWNEQYSISLMNAGALFIWIEWLYFRGLCGCATMEYSTSHSTTRL